MPFYANGSFICNGTDYNRGDIMKLEDVNALNVLERMVDSGLIVTDEDLSSRGWLTHVIAGSAIHFDEFKRNTGAVAAKTTPEAPIAVKKAAVPVKKATPAPVKKATPESK